MAEVSTGGPCFVWVVFDHVGQFGHPVAVEMDCHKPQLSEYSDV